TDQRAAIGVEGFRHVIRAGDELSRHMACAPRHFGKLGAAAFAAIGVESTRGAADDYGSTRSTLGGKLSRVAADGARLLCVDRLRLWPAALDMTEPVGAHAPGLAALGR